ncbi:DUF982 domain-containing protein [Rhizobium sp. YTU87027]|uniref:DUF982 domain-containing protein n=1 Tax=Rhizobium sp. YTU87027 TaxID=3417741 RepID=UPI003D68C5DB
MNWHRSGDFIPLMLMMGGPEKYRLITSLGDVAEALIAAWPIDDGEDYVVAVKACLDAIHGNASPQDARAALISAAREAGIPVITVAH